MNDPTRPSDDAQPPAGGVSFSNNQSGDDASNQQALKIDNSKHQTTHVDTGGGAFEGGIQNYQAESIEFDFAEAKEAAQELLGKDGGLSSLFLPPGDEASEIVDAHPEGETVPVAIDTSMHPQTLLAEVESMSDRAEAGETITKEEQSSFFDRFKGMVGKAVEVGKDAVEKLGPVAVAVMKVKNVTPPPYSYIIAGLEAAIDRVK